MTLDKNTLEAVNKIERTFSSLQQLASSSENISTSKYMSQKGVTNKYELMKLIKNCQNKECNE
ncbi:hypothetical protein KHA80_00685 [Anaerobacillus sp. HL2]|nr:hypothetical protein KHA80_00685 [Anaerobacillus sp. HL2]